MKKIYFLLCAMLVAFAANAADYYIVGGFNRWANGSAACKFTDKGDGTYALDYAGEFSGEFLITQGNWNWKLGGGGALSANDEYQLVEYGANIKVNGTLSNPHFVLNPAKKTLLATVEGTVVPTPDVIGYAIWGQIGGGNWQAYDLTKGEDGLWSTTMTIVPGEFGIRQYKNTITNQTQWYGSLDTSTIDAAGTYTVGSGKNFKSNLKGEFKISFDSASAPMTITFERIGEDPTEPEQPTPDVVTYGIHGQIFGDPNWATTLLEKESDDVWTLTATLVPGEFGIKHLTNGAQTTWYSASGNNLVNTPGSYGVKAYGSNFKSTLEGEYIITFNLADMTIAFASTAVVDPNVPVWEDPASKLYIKGTVFGNALGEEVEMTSAGEVATFSYTGTIVPGTFEFVLRDAQGVTADVFGANSQNAAVTGEGLYGIHGQGYTYTNRLKGTATITVHLAPEKLDFTVSDFTPANTDVYFVAPEGWTPMIHFDSVRSRAASANEMTKAVDNLWKASVPAGITTVQFSNNGDEATLTPAVTITDGHKYDQTGADLGVANLNGTPDHLYLIGSCNGWNTAAPDTMTKVGDTFVIKSVPFSGDNCLFTFITTPGADWDAVNAGLRYGPNAYSDVTLSGNDSFALNSGSSFSGDTKSWIIPAGTYDISVNFATKTVNAVLSSSAVESIEAGEAAPALYLNLQGVQVENPAAGTYIRVQGGRAVKVQLR